MKTLNSLGAIQQILDTKKGVEISQEEIEEAKKRFKKEGGKIKKFKTEYQTYESWEFNSGLGYSRAGYTPKSGAE